MRRRTCRTEPCKGDTIEAKNCKIGECPGLLLTIFNLFLFNNYIFVVVNAKWQPWGPYSQCTATCGNGTQVRARACGEAEYGGDEVCHGHSTEIQDCSVADCPSKFHHPLSHNMPKLERIDPPYHLHHEIFLLHNVSVFIQ